jgi:hypothetical protein
MRHNFKKCSDEDLLRRIDLLNVWIRDAKEAKRAEIGRIRAELSRRRGKGKVGCA